MSGEAELRLARAAAALRAAGLEGTVEAAGREGEIAAFSLRPGAWERLPEAEARALVAAVRAAGFRYVAQDLEG